MSKKNDQNKEESNERKSVDLSPYIDVIQQRFFPASSREEATQRFSTQEVRAAIKQLNPGLEVYETHVFDAMVEAGFRFDSIPGNQSLQFQWLLIEK